MVFDLCILDIEWVFIGCIIEVKWRLIIVEDIEWLIKGRDVWKVEI